ncbi:MAG: hypothetical protein LBH00_11635 [Planctomycetaceae bacterium]|jgi:hypothetical protein|nr:hypothetical protein [Planctomycetaceae bacterium]
MSSSETSAAARLLQCLHSVAPRSKHSVSHPFHTVIPGLPAGISPIAEILKRISIKDLQNAFAQFLIKRRSSRCRKGVPVLSARYYVSSLPSDTVFAKRFQESILRHWAVENCLHSEKDKESGEDKHVFRSVALGMFGRS